MFLIRSLILSREVFFVNRDYRKLSHISRLERFVHARTLARCLRKKSVSRLFCRQIPSFFVIYISFLN